MELGVVNLYVDVGLLNIGFGYRIWIWIWI